MDKEALFPEILWQGICIRRNGIKKERNNDSGIRHNMIGGFYNLHPVLQ